MTIEDMVNKKILSKSTNSLKPVNIMYVTQLIDENEVVKGKFHFGF